MNNLIKIALNVGIFNMLEAMILVYGIFFLNKDRIKISIRKNMKHFYILGIINCLIQSLSYAISNDLVLMIYNSIIVAIIMPIVLFVYVNTKMFRCSLVKCIKSFVIYMAVLLLFVQILDLSILPFDDMVIFMFDNTLIKILQFSLLGVDYIVKRYIIKNN